MASDANSPTFMSQVSKPPHKRHGLFIERHVRLVLLRANVRTGRDPAVDVRS